MALQNHNRIQETTQSSGDANFLLAGALTGYRPFASGVGDGNICYYTVEHYVENQWEIGLGAYSEGTDTLSRDNIIDSSNGGNKIDFAAGVKSIFVDIPESKRLYYDENDNIFIKNDVLTVGSGVFKDSVHTDNHYTSAEWKDAYDWGDHSSVGYLEDINSESINDLSDVNTAGIASGKILKYNGAAWVIDDDDNTTYTAGDFAHNSLDGLDTGDYRHLTATQKTDLTDSGPSSLHYHTSDRARGNHTGTQATSTLTSTAYRTFYSDSAGDVQSLAHGSNGQVLTSNGASANPSWQDAAATYTNEMAQDAVGGILYNSPEISLTYVDGNPSISGDLIAGSIDVLKLDSGVQDSLGLADSALQSGANISELTNDSSYITASSSNTLTNKSGSNSQWTNDEGYITSADGGNATTLDSLDSTAFLRSNTSDSFTNGTLTISTGTELLVDGLLNVDGTINIASTTISLDGPSTDFNADGGTITFNTNDLVIKTSTGYIGINETDPRAHLDVAGSGYFYNGVHTENHDTSAEWKEAYDWGDHSTQGYLIDITNESIGDLTNVDVTGAANGKVLKYNSGTWEIADDNDTTYTAGSFNHNDLDGLNDGTSYQHITQTEKTNFGTAYTHSGLTSGNPHSVSKSDVALDNVPNVDCTNASNITSGTISSSILPPVALTEVTVVVSEVAQLALTAEEGDVAVRSDENKTYMHNGGSAGTMADWTELQTPTDTVLSVNGETGTVVLTTSEIGEDADHNYVTDAQLVVIGNTSGTNTGDQSAGDFSHNSLDDLNVGTNYQHITTTQESNFESAYSHISNNGSDHSYIDQDVTSGSSPTFDGTNFSGIPGTALDDTYIKANGAQALTANWDAGGYEIRARTLESDVATGTAPLTIASTTLVNNLNSDKLDNQEGSYYLARGNHTGTQLANTISDFDTEVANNSDVSSNTSARHTRSHTMTSTSDHTAGEWKVFYSNAAGVQELALGSSGKVLTANGTSSAPTWETPASVSGFVPYTGATSDVDLGEHDLDLAGMLSLNPVGATVGSIRLWDNNTEYLELKCEGNSGFITVDTDGGTAGNLYLTSNLTLFSTGASRFNGDLTILGDLLPNSDSTYDIGSTGTRWQTLYVDNITTTDDGTSANWKAAYDWGDHDGLYADLSHSHGNINNDGEIGTTANLPIITTTGGVLTTGSFGSSANTFCEGDDSRLSDARTPTSHDNTYHSTNYAAETVTLTAGTGLTGGGNLTTNRTFAVSYGTSASTACEGNDSRLSDSRTPTAHTLDGALHTVSGLTPGHFLKATGADTFGFAAHGLTASDVSALSSATNSTQNGYFGDVYLSDGSSNYMSITCSDNLSSNRILSIDPNNANRTISLSGNLTVSSTATISGTNTGDQSAISDFSGTKSEFNSACTDGTFLYVGDVSTHDAVTVTDSDEIDFTLTGQDITAVLKSGSIDETKLDTSVNDSLDLADSAIQAADLGSAAYEDTSAFAAASHAHGNITSAGAVTSTATVASTDRILIVDTGSSSVVTGGPEFGTSTSTYLRNNGTWGTPTNTTYTEISESEINTGTASDLRTITGRRAAYIIGKSVPYTGATSDVDLGTYDITAATITLNSAGGQISNFNNTSGSTDLTQRYGYAGYGWIWKYLGSGTGNNNEFQLWSEGAGGTDVEVFNITQDGNINFLEDVTIDGQLSASLVGITGTKSQFDTACTDGNFLFESDATTVGTNLLGLTNPSAVTFLRVNADNTIDTLSDSLFRTAISAAATNQTMYIGTTAVAINRSSATLNLAGIGTLSTGAITSVGITNHSTTIGTRMATTASAATQIPVFVSDPASTTCTLYTRTPSQLLSDIGAAASSHAHGNITSAGAVTSTATVASTDRILIVDTGSSSVVTGGPAFGTSTSTYLRNDGSWATPTNTTYSAMSVAEGQTGTATTSRVMRADYLKSITEYRIGQTNPKSHDNTYHSTNYAAETVTLTAGTGLTGGGNLTTNRTFTVSYGTSAGTACQGNDSRLHTRSHAIDGASDHTATAYRTFYSDSAGDVQQLSHGTSGQVLTSNGASADPSWQDAAGGGVPYTGATADVDLGSYDLTATDGTFDGDVTLSAGNLYLPESSSTEGAIYINGTRVFHTYAPEDPSSNTFVGRSCGNTSSITHTTDNEGRFNVGVGYNACPSLTTGYNNMCVGTSAGRVLSSGHDNLCIGFAAGYDITTGQNNVCMGTYSGFHIAGADYNVALGARPLYACVTGDYNTAIGFYSLYSTTNSRNIGIGANAGRTNTSGFGNIFIGYSAGFVSGQSAISSYEIGIGYLAKVTGNRGIAIGYQAEAGQDEAVIGGTDTTRTSLQGDLCIDDCAAPGATNGATIAFPDNDGEPDPATGTACIYAQDVAGSGVHMFAISETGTGQRISPHDPVTGEWVFYGFNTKTGKRQQVNMEKMVRTIEELTGEQFLEEWYE
jgi:hypothetical protein